MKLASLQAPDERVSETQPPVTGIGGVTRILDASSLLTFLHDEPGADRVRSALAGALVSAVNWFEVVQKSLRREADVKHAESASHFWDKTRHHGLSLADRACLALAM